MERTNRELSPSSSACRHGWIFAGLLITSAAVLGTGMAFANQEDDAVFDQLLRHSKREIRFDLVRSKGIQMAGCLLNAAGHVKVNSIGPVEIMSVDVEGLPPHTDFDLFVIQVPNAPFGLSWYQGDIETDDLGRAHQRFIGRFNIETFIVAPGQASAPVVHNGPFPDASMNPQTPPVHEYHLGLWFNSPNDATANACPGATTPFNGDHTAGLQVLNTSNFNDDQGPLRQLNP